MKILFEETRPQDVSFSDYSVIVEQANAKSPSKIKIRGCYIACDCKNVNGRTYSFDYFEKEVIPEYRRIWVDQKRAYAELNHAQSHVVNPKDACELITNFTSFLNVMVMNYINDTICALATPQGSGAIGIIRLSGSGSIEIIDKFFSAPNGHKMTDTESNKMVFGTFSSNGKYSSHRSFLK